MPVGDSSLIAGLSYLAVARETAAGTYQTCTSVLDFVSHSLKVSKEVKVLEQVERSRTYSKQIQMVKNSGGDLEFFYSPQIESCNYMLHVAFGGGAVSSATATGETSGAGANSAITHTFSLQQGNATYSSLSINLRKGDTSGGKVFEYHGCRVNEMTLVADIDEPLKVSTSLVAMKSTQTSNNIGNVLTATVAKPLNFVNGRFSVEGTFASLTSSSFWHVQSLEFSMANNLKADTESRRIGSDEFAVLPYGMCVMEIKATIRFDTLTAYSAMINNTAYSAEFEFLGDTFSSSSIREGLRIQFPRVYISEAGDPEIGGPDELLTSEVLFKVLQDDSSSGGYAVRALLTNRTASY